MNNFPIPKITPSNQALATEIEILVDKILALKKNTTGTSDTQADTAALESAIDELVFDLYELTAEERKIIW